MPCSEVNELDDLLTDPHLADVGFFDINGIYPDDIRRTLPQPVEFAGIERDHDRPPGPMGHDTREVLRECGLDDGDIDALIVSGAAFAAVRVSPAKGEAA